MFVQYTASTGAVVDQDLCSLEMPYKCESYLISRIFLDTVFDEAWADMGMNFIDFLFISETFRGGPAFRDLRGFVVVM